MQIYLAPMEGITGYIVRNAFYHQFGGIDKFFTPFIPAAKRMGRKILRDLDPANNTGIRLVPQLISNNSDEIFQMVLQLQDLGFSEININLGCPSGTVVSKKRGSGMLQDPQELDRFLDGIFTKAAAGASDVKISVKTRIGFTDLDLWPALLAVYLHYPLQELIIHPRLRREMYGGFPHLESYQLAYEAFQEPAVSAGQMPGDGDGAARKISDRLCYNGDIWDMNCFRDILRRFPETRKIMIGRGLLGRPYLAWLIRQAECAEAGSSALSSDIFDSCPSGRGSSTVSDAAAGPDGESAASFPQNICAELFLNNQDWIRTRIRRFHDEIYEGYLGIFSGERDVFLHMKEIWANLGRSFNGSERLVRKLMRSTSPMEYKALSDQILDAQELSSPCLPQ